MKTTFICVFILTILPSVYGILCHCPKKDINTFLDPSTVDEFKVRLRQNVLGEEKNVCYLKMTMIYSKALIQIGFTSTLKEAEIETVEGDTLFAADIEKGSVVIEHACSTHNYCDIDFIFDHVQWLVDGKYQETFAQNSASLRARTGPQIENCHSTFDTSRIGKCSPGDRCTLSWDSHGLFQFCEDHLPLGIYILAQINMKFSEDYQMLKFVCGYEQCNSNETFVELKSLFDQYFNLTSMREALFKNRSIQIEQSTTQQLDSTDISTESLMTTNIYSTDPMKTTSRISSTKSSTRTTKKTNSSSAVSSFSPNIAFWFLCICRFISE